MGDGTLASMLVPGCHSQFCHLSYALLLSEPIKNETIRVETFNTLKMCLKTYVQIMLNLNVFSAVVCRVIRKFKIYSHKVQYDKFQLDVSYRMFNKKCFVRNI